MKRSLVIALVCFAALGVAAASMAADGASVYKAKCAMCHGANGEGTAMANPFVGNDFISGSSEAVIADVITNGRSGPDKKYSQYAMGMAAQKLGADELSAVIAHLKSLASK